MGQETENVTDARTAETTTTTTFVLRFWREWTGSEARWRGRIEHVQSGRRSDFLGVGELLGFLEGFGIHKESIISEEEHKAILDRFNVELNKGNLDIVYEFLAPEFVGHSPLWPEPIQGPDGYKAFLATLGTGMPDLHYPSWTLIADGDLVAIHLLVDGTFTNELMGIPPNGKKIAGWNANIWRFAGEKLVEWWQYLDTLELMQQLGAIPPQG
jgi:predicted ester cyclase